MLQIQTVHKLQVKNYHDSLGRERFRTGWTIMSGTWNHLRKVWGPTPDTLAKIQDSCKIQENLEEANVFSPTRHLLLTIKRLWQIDRVHGLPAVVAPAFFPSASKGGECWWGTQDLSTIYLWDTMDNEDRQDSLEALREKDNWVIWKTKDNKWTQDLQRAGFHQLLPLNKNTRADCWGNKIKGWWRRGVGSLSLRWVMHSWRRVM